MASEAICLFFVVWSHCIWMALSPHPPYACKWKGSLCTDDLRDSNRFWLSCAWQWQQIIDAHSFDYQKTDLQIFSQNAVGSTTTPRHIDPLHSTWLNCGTTMPCWWLRSAEVCRSFMFSDSRIRNTSSGVSAAVHSYGHFKWLTVRASSQALSWAALNSQMARGRD